MKCFMGLEMLSRGSGDITPGMRAGISFGRHMGLFMGCKMTAFHVILVALVAFERTLQSEGSLEQNTCPVWVLKCSCRRQGFLNDLSQPS